MRSRGSKLSGALRADLTALARRTEDLVYVVAASLGLGLLGSYSGGYSSLLAVLAISQLASYLLIIRDFEKGVLYILIYYLGFFKVYIIKFTSILIITALGAALASAFSGPAYAPMALALALVDSAAAGLASVFAVYGGLPPQASLAVSTALALPPSLRIAASGASPPGLLTALSTLLVCLAAAYALDRPA